MKHAITLFSALLLEPLAALHAAPFTIDLTREVTAPAAANRRLILNLHYTGDAARLYFGDKLIDDHFYNGDPMPIALWRLPADQWSNLRLKILPYSDALDARLPEEAKHKVAAAKAASALGQITVTIQEQTEVQVTEAENTKGTTKP